MSDKRRAEQVAEVLDGLDSPTVEAVSTATREFDADDVAAAAAHKALEVSLDATVAQQDTDPGAIGAGSIWVNTGLSVGQPVDTLPIFVRNATNDGWISQGLAYYVDGEVKSFVTVGDGGVVAELLFGEPGVGLALTEDEAVIRHGGTYLWIQPGINLAYIHLEDGVRFWFNNPLNADTWGISDPSGSEMFAPIPAPDDSELADFPALRLQWFDATAGAAVSRYKQKDADGTITTGRSVGLSDSGVMKLPGLPTSDPHVADEVWSDAGVLKVSAG